jgi:hypothetical protein
VSSPRSPKGDLGAIARINAHEAALASVFEIKYLPEMRFEKRGEHERVIQCIDRIAAERITQRRLEPRGRRRVRQYSSNHRLRCVFELSGLAHRA